MTLIGRIIGTWRDPRGAIRALLAGPAREDRALADQRAHARDPATGLLDLGRVRQLPRGRLEAEVEQRLVRLVQLLLQVFVGHRPQRDGLCTHE
jgi:hypothetical protein